MSARDRYRNDLTYKQVVDYLHQIIDAYGLTPAEMREAAVLASINYEMLNIRQFQIPLTPELHARLEELHLMVEKETSNG